MMKRLALVCAVVSLVGCNDRPSPIEDDGQAELGVVKFEVSSSGTALDVRGLADDGSVVAWLRLRMEVVADGEHTGLGRSLTVELRGADAITYASIGLEPVHLAPPDDAEVALFLLDEYVAEQLALHGIRMGAHEVIGDTETNFGHGGSCTMGADSWIPQCQGTGFTSCCMTHLNAYGYQPQTVACGNASPKAKAERACFAPPSCTSGKAYGTNPIGCDSAGQASCPAGTTATVIAGTGKYQCKVDSGAPNSCAAKFVGPAGCATCWTANYAGTLTATYNATWDTCSAPTHPLHAVVTADAGAGGTVTSNLGSINCHSSGSPGACTTSPLIGENSYVALYAVPDAGSLFAGWSGPCTGTDPQCVARMTATWFAYAHFVSAEGCLGPGAPCSEPTDCCSNVCTGGGVCGYDQ